MNNYRANQHRLGRNARGKVYVRFAGTGHPVRSRVPQRSAAQLLAEVCEEAGETICPKLGAAQWSCSREECICHRKEYAHAHSCSRLYGGPCTCGAKV